MSPQSLLKLAFKNNEILNIFLRTYQMLNAEEKKKAVAVFVGIAVNNVVEILGLAFVIPVLGLVVEPETIHTNRLLRISFETCALMGFNTPTRFLIGLCVMLVLAFLIKGFFGLLMTFIQTRFSYKIAHRITGGMWNYHFASVARRVQAKNSGRVISEINNWPVMFAKIFLVGGFLSLSEILISLTIVVGLFLYNPTVTLSVVLLMVFGTAGIRILTKSRLSNYSITVKKLEPQTNTLINNSIQGFLEIITFGALPVLKQSYLDSRWKIMRINSNIAVLQITPAKLYEILAVMAVVCSTILVLLQEKNQAESLELISLLALSAYRIMPSMSRLNGAIIKMRSQGHILEAMEQVKEENSQSLPIDQRSFESHWAKVAIKTNDVSFSYDQQTWVLRNLNHLFASGRIHGIVGPSGSGKSTLLGGILGISTPTSGTIEIELESGKKKVLGRDIEGQEWLGNVAFVSQRPFLFPGSLKENITMRTQRIDVDEEEVLQLIEELQLRDCLGSDPLNFEIQESGGNLSGGQQQRIALVRALQLKRPVLVLDEATSALDEDLRNIVFDILRKRAEAGCNVIIVTHDMALASECDDILTLQILEQRP